MEVYSLCCVDNNAGCYGVFSSMEKATARVEQLCKDWGYDKSSWEETVWDGFHKHIYFENNEFEIWRHKIDE